MQFEGIADLTDSEGFLEWFQCWFLKGGRSHDNIASPG
jgi:hypothetical protein